MVSPSSVSDVMLISRLLQSSANVGIYLLIVDPPLSVWGRVNILNTIVFPPPPPSPPPSFVNETAGL